jgi:ubiquinone/menaquinone biosynthesis C-methylase UbiE
MSDVIRDLLRNIWSNAAPAWSTHADYVDDRGADVTRAMLDATGTGPGKRVLELACGPAGAGLAAAEIVGAHGEVVLTDVAPEMTAIAAARAEVRRLRNVKTTLSGMEDLPFPDASFDVALCREGLMLVISPATAAREARRVLVPDGRAAFTVWGPRERNPWLGVLFDVLTAHLGVTVPPPGMPDPFALSGQRELEVVLGEAGFEEVTIREVKTPMNASSFEEWWTVVPSLAGPVGPALAAQPPDVVTAIREDAHTRLDRYRTEAGYELPGLSLVGSGRH